MLVIGILELANNPRCNAAEYPVSCKGLRHGQQRGRSQMVLPASPHRAGNSSHVHLHMHNCPSHSDIPSRHSIVVAAVSAIKFWSGILDLLPLTCCACLPHPAQPKTPSTQDGNHCHRYGEVQDDRNIGGALSEVRQLDVQLRHCTVP